jgi:hypothetical protein
MVLQLLAPGMEDGQKANVGPEMRGILRNGYEGLGDRLDQEGIEEAGVLEGEPIEHVGQGKDDMEVRHCKEFTLPGRQPSGLCHPLALGTMPIAARVITDLLMPAGIALALMASQGRGAALGEGAEHALLRRRRALPVPREIGCPILLDDVGDFEWGAGHRNVSSTRAMS